MKNLYQEELLDHYRYPRNRGELQNADFCSKEHNPSCGDMVQFFGSIYQEKIILVTFQGHGCVISQAAASMLTEKVLNITVEKISTFDEKTICDMIGMQLGPVRIKCALLSLIALKNGIQSYKKR